MNKDVASSSKAHQSYYNKKGIRLPSVTAITGVMDKGQGLIIWANHLGLKGIDSSKYVDVLSGAGTLAHEGVECDLNDREWDTSNYTKTQINLAKNSVRKWYIWLDKQKFKMIFSEKDLISEKYQFGGRCDIYGLLNRKRTLIDLKTCKGLWPEHGTQVAGYKILLEENGFPVDEVRIIRLPREDAEGSEPEDKLISNIDLHTRRFLICKQLYDINKKIIF